MQVDEFLYANAEDYLRRRVPVNQLREFIENKTEIEYLEEFTVTFKHSLLRDFREMAILNVRCLFHYSPVLLPRRLSVISFVTTQCCYLCHVAINE
jgi:hypothetical protein